MTKTKHCMFIRGSCHFVVKTDHHSLKFLLEQRITTPCQQKWLVKLLGYDYTMVYKKKNENIVADALSKREEMIQLCSFSGLHSVLLDQIKHLWTQDPDLHKLIQTIQIT